MRNIPPELADSFLELEKFIKESDLPYKDAVLSYYSKLGEELDFSVRDNFSVLKYGLNLGKIDLLWAEPNVTFTLEFSNLDSLLGKLIKVVEFAPDAAILVLSSVSGCRPKDVKSFFEKTEVFDKDTIGMFVILDISEKRVIQL